jgi:6-phospho-beta-glucosidase
MSELKIAIIGGGSSYTPELIEGFIDRYHDLPISEICLLDILEGATKLDIIQRLSLRMVQKASKPIKITHTLDRERALLNCAFVITQIRVGGIHARITDETIAFEHDMIGQETNGLAGFGKALRTIPVILSIVKDMERLCPNAWLINFTNPAGIITEVVSRFSKIKVVGLCNVPVNMQKLIEAHVTGDSLFVQMTGLNHYVYAHQIKVDGKEQLPFILEPLLNDETFNPKNIGHASYQASQIKGLGVLPCYYHTYYYLKDEMYSDAKAAFEKEGSRGAVVKAVEEELFKIYADPNLSVKPEALSKRGGAYYSEAACELIRSIYVDKRNFMVVNVPNNGTLKELPDDAVIETTCIITKSGPLPLPVTTLPFPIRAEITAIKGYERLVIEAALNNSYDIAMQALTVHPLCTTGNLLKSALDELVKANKAYFKLV